MSSIGIYRTKHTLQKLHFTTIIDVICLPLALFAVLFTFGISHSRIIYSTLIAIFLSPISAYFLGKLYYTMYTSKNQDKPEILDNN